VRLHLVTFKELCLVCLARWRDGQHGTLRWLENLEDNLVCGFHRDYVIPSAKIIKHKVVMRDDVRCGKHSVVSRITQASIKTTAET
jgi:hypothetical protein